MDKFGFDEVTSSAGDVQQDAVGSWLTKGGMMDGTDSATARHEDEAKRNPNGTADVIDRKGFAELLEDCSSKGTKLKTDDYSAKGKYAIVDQGQQIIAGYTDQEEGVYSDVPAIIFGDHTRAVKYIDVPFFLGADGTKLLKAKNTGANYKYLYYALKAAHIPNTGYNRHFKWVKELQFNYPSDEEQIKIVDQLDRLQLLIDKRNEQLNQLDTLIKARFVEMFGNPEDSGNEWEQKPLSDLLNVIGGYAFKSDQFSEIGGIPVLRIGNINAGVFRPVNMVYWEDDEKLERYAIYAGDLVMSLTGTVGKDDYGNVCIMGNEYDKYYLNQRNAKLEIKSGLDKYYLSELLKFECVKKKLTGISRGVRQANISNKDILNLVVNVPPIELQNQFAAFVTQVDKLKLK